MQIILCDELEEAKAKKKEKKKLSSFTFKFIWVCFFKTRNILIFTCLFCNVNGLCLQAFYCKDLHFDDYMILEESGDEYENS
jgi:hypothetical protein